MPLSRPPHRARRARPRLPRGQHGALGRRHPAAVLHAREHRHVASSRWACFGGCKTIFGAEADVAFREQGYLIMATPRVSRCSPRTWRCSSRMGADIVLLDGAALARALSLAGDRMAGRGRLRPHGRGLVRPAELRHPAAQGRGRQRRTILHDRVVGIDAAAASRASRWRAGAHRLPEPSSTPPGPGLAHCRAGRHSNLPVEPRKRFVYVIDSREATEALRQAPLTVDPSGVWFRPGGSLLPLRQIAGGRRGAAGRQPGRHRPRLLRAAGLAPAGRARARIRERQGRQRLGRLLRLQHARPERGDRSASRRRRISISPTASRATAPSRPPPPAAPSPS